MPSGVGSGTLYKQNKLNASYQAKLLTQMIVHPAGMPTLPDNWLFTTATNRTEKTVEVVGIFFGAAPESLGVFDWSCSQAYPCPNGALEPSWQWTKQLVTDLTCYYAERTGGDGYSYSTLRYANKSVMVDAADPPLWRNKVNLWNFCDQAWDLVYKHEFRVRQKDCSADSSCGWWGPIIETFFTDPQPPISRLGFEETTLTHDYSKSNLGPKKTDFVTPADPWQTYYLQPNSSWIVGP